MNNAIGSTTAVGNVTVNGTSNIGLGAITTIAGKTINVTTSGTGNKIFPAGMAVGAAENITLTADDLTINGNMSGTGTVTSALFQRSQYVCQLRHIRWDAAAFKQH